MVLTIAYNPQFALLMSLSLAILMALRRGRPDAAAGPPGRAGDGGAGAAGRADADPAGRGRAAAGVAFAAMTAAAEVLTGQTLRFC